MKTVLIGFPTKTNRNAAMRAARDAKACGFCFKIGETYEVVFNPAMSPEEARRRADEIIARAGQGA